MTQAEAIRTLQSEYEQQRERNRDEENRRLDEVAARDSRVAALIGARLQGLHSTLRQALANPDGADGIVAGFARRLSETRTALQQALAAQGLPANYLEPVYRCPVCRDTGEVGEPLARYCSCFQQRLVQLLCSDSDLAALADENFEAFDECIYPEEPLPGKDMTQRAYMRRMRQICEAYADAFPGEQPRNLLFCGASGLGKTFLMNCIAQRVLARGFNVMRMTATRLVEVMRRYHYNGDGADIYARLVESDLLLLDDLGAEPMIENVTIVHLLGILNERLAAQRNTIISTNFSIAELSNAYTERVASRLLDVRTTRVLPFFGQDVRRRR